MDRTRKDLVRLFIGSIINHTINNIFPLRFGELARIYLASEKEKVPTSVAVGSIVLEKSIDSFALIVPQRVADAIDRQVEALLNSIAEISNKRHFTTLVGWSAVIWLLLFREHVKLPRYSRPSNRHTELTPLAATSSSAQSGRNR